jgi:riboflavin synthase
MYTGIIEQSGRLLDVQAHGEGLKIKVESQFDDLIMGESIAVDGICLTVAGFDKNIFHCDLSRETLKLTTAKNFQAGRKVNLERSLRLGDRMGGHWIYGHVDHTAIVEKISDQDGFRFVRINCEADPNSLHYLIHKGSISVNGVSLTINALDDQGFELMLIPETLATTNLATLNTGDFVNIEIDWMSKLIVRQCQTWLTQKT